MLVRLSIAHEVSLNSFISGVWYVPVNELDGLSG
jgi:hypothetical protein